MRRRTAITVMFGSIGGVSVSAGAEKVPAFDDFWIEKWNDFAKAANVFLEERRQGQIDLKQWKRVVSAGKRVGVYLLP